MGKWRGDTSAFAPEHTATTPSWCASTCASPCARTCAPLDIHHLSLNKVGLQLEGRLTLHLKQQRQHYNDGGRAHDPRVFAELGRGLHVAWAGRSVSTKSITRGATTMTTQAADERLAA